MAQFSPENIILAVKWLCRVVHSDYLREHMYHIRITKTHCTVVASSSEYYRKNFISHEIYELIKNVNLRDYAPVSAFISDENDKIIFASYESVGDHMLGCLFNDFLLPDVQRTYVVEAEMIMRYLINQMDTNQQDEMHMVSLLKDLS